jgi:putative DNA primase/helicase
MKHTTPRARRQSTSSSSNGRAPQVGDLVQWLINRENQFLAPKRVLRIDPGSDGLLYCELEGASCRVLLDQCIVVVEEEPPAPDPPPAADGNIHLATALQWLDAGFSPLPAREDGTKAPIADVQINGEWTWSPYQTTPATREHVEHWYANGRQSNGVAGGPGGLEPFEFDDRGVYARFKELAVEFGLGDVVERVEAGYLEDTPSGGAHWMWKCNNPGPPMKLAQRPDPSRPHGRRTLIETKGQGGFIIVAPSCGTVHPSGKPYVLLRGGPSSIATITDDEREALLALARSLDEMPPEEVKDPPRSKQKTGGNTRWPEQGISPGDAFNAQATWDDIVEPHGWVEVKPGLWRRPGKDKGISASTQKTKGFRVYTTSTSLDTKSYSRFGLYCFLNHRGNWAECVKDLAQQGYGTWKDEDGTEHQNPVPKGWKPKASSSGAMTAPAQMPSAKSRQLPHAVGNEGPEDPHRLARTYVADRCSHDGGSTLIFHRNEFWCWDGTCYRPMDEEELTAGLTACTKAEFDRINPVEVQEWEARGRKDRANRPSGPPETRKVTRVLLANVAQALKGMGIVPSRLDPPAWLIEDPPFPANEVIPCRNGLLHLPSFLQGKPALHKSTPAYFGCHSLEFDFDPDANPGPPAWLHFLESIFAHDRESIPALQEWMGYLLTADTSHQKIGLFIGPTRSGKGTIARIITALIGKENVATPSMAEFGLEFGLQELIGKPLVIVGDARVSGKQDTQMAVERLLAISGEDSVQIDRKYLRPWNGRLPGRLMILSNLVPRLPDSSRALPGRMLAFRLVESWKGREDTKLEGKLKSELPGILIWAIYGWEKLQREGRFLQPDSGQSIIDEMNALGSPIGTYVEERCSRGPQSSIPTKDLFRDWKEWCDSMNLRPGSDAEFGQNLRAFDASIVRTRPRDPSTGIQVPHYEGIELAKGGVFTATAKGP